MLFEQYRVCLLFCWNLCAYRRNLICFSILLSCCKWRWCVRLVNNETNDSIGRSAEIRTWDDEDRALERSTLSRRRSTLSFLQQPIQPVYPRQQSSENSLRRYRYPYCFVYAIIFAEPAKSSCSSSFPIFVLWSSICFVLGLCRESPRTGWQPRVHQPTLHQFTIAQRPRRCNKLSCLRHNYPHRFRSP